MTCNHRKEVAELCSEYEVKMAKANATLTELRISLEYTQSEVAEIKEACSRHTSTLDSVATERLQPAETKITKLDRQLDYIENQSRRNNIRIDGIPEVHGETWEGTEQKCLQIFQNSLGLSNIQVERANCIGKNSQ